MIRHLRNYAWLLAFAAAVGIVTAPVLHVREAQAQFTLNPYAPTYSASIGSASVAATATDIFCVEGGSSGVTKVMRIQIIGAATTAGGTTVDFFKRTTLNTGGTFTTTNPLAHDSKFAASTVTLRAYTANPTTLGTSSATSYYHTALQFPVLATAGAFPSSLDFTPFAAVGTLNGTTEAICANLNGGTAPAGASFTVNVTLQQG